jgi:hypothetical protein
MIGRDKILSKEIYPRCKGKKAAFLLEGHRGVGKSAILQWAYQYGEEPKALISTTWTVKENMLAIVKGWGLTIRDGEKQIPLSRAKLSELEDAIMGQKKGAIYIDDIQAATPAFLRRFKVWRERFKVFGAGVPPFKKEELKRNIWGLERIKVDPIAKQYRLELATKACEYYFSKKSPREIAHHSRGYPGRILAMAQGTIEVKAERVKGEELDLSPVLLVMVIGIAALRYLGRGLDDTALYLMGGIGVAVMIALRFFLSRGMR